VGSSSPGEGSPDPRRSSYGREHWLHRCDGFVVETATRRLGKVVGVRFGAGSNKPEVIEVRAGLLGRTLLLLSVEDVIEILPEQRRVLVKDPPRLLAASSP
jgi:hypothetical protein